MSKFISSVSVLVIIGVLVFSIGCHKELITDDPGKKLRVESDTLSFDTVFTSIGSATRSLKIYNDHDENIIIDRIYISGGNATGFNLNVDGRAGYEISNVEVRAHDSIYLFSEVKINPNDPPEISPFIKSEVLVIDYNDNLQSLVLLAYGQHANYFPDKLNKGNITTIDLQGGTLIWDDPKPYILYGIVYIDNGTLLIPAGTKIYVWGGLTKTKDQNGNTFFYNDGRLIIGSNATLKVEGTKELPVIFQGVRLEQEFQETAGQWSGIFLDQYSKSNVINYAIIRNNLIGLVVDSLAACEINNTKIYNNSLYGIYASTATVKITNSLFYNQGASGLELNTGGDYSLDYCTVVNTGNSEPALSLSNFRCIDFPFCDIRYHADLKAILRNSIFYGSDEDEIWMTRDSSSAFNPFFYNCLFRITDLTKVFPEFINTYTSDCINYFGFDRLFKDLNNNDYHPDTLSVLEMKAIPINSILFDLDAFPRDPVLPDIGCYEYK